MFISQPAAPNLVLANQALFMQWGPLQYQDPVNQFSVVSYTSNFSNPSKAGVSQVASYDTTNQITKIAREVRRLAAGAAGSTGFWQIASPLISGSVVFPGANKDAGFKIQMLAGFDGTVTSPQADCEMLLGCGTDSAGGQIPSAGTRLKALTDSWLGFYMDGASIGFGYKNAGSAVITQLNDFSSLGMFSAYQIFKVTINVNPNGPNISYGVSYMGAGDIAFRTAGSGSFSGGWAPGRVQIAPQVNLYRSTVTGIVDLWLSLLSIQVPVQGSLSL